MYAVLVDENARYGDEGDQGERYVHDTFETYDEAVAACQRIVDDFLALQHRPGMTADDLYRLYTTFGEDPFIHAVCADRADAAGTDGDVGEQRQQGSFSAWEYACLRCALLCRP